MGITNWFMQRSMIKEARRLGKMVPPLYSDAKSRNSNATEAEMIKDMAFHVFNKEELVRIPESSRKRIEICCETVQGYLFSKPVSPNEIPQLLNTDFIV